MLGRITRPALAQLQDQRNGPESATETWFINNPVLDLEAYATWLHDNIHMWKRKEFADFKYLGVNLSPTAKWIVSILTIVLTAAIIYFSYAIYTGQK